MPLEFSIGCRARQGLTWVLTVIHDTFSHISILPLLYSTLPKVLALPASILVPSFTECLEPTCHPQQLLEPLVSRVLWTGHPGVNWYSIPEADGNKWVYLSKAAKCIENIHSDKRWQYFQNDHHAISCLSARQVVTGFPVRGFWYSTCQLAKHFPNFHWDSTWKGTLSFVSLFVGYSWFEREKKVKGRQFSAPHTHQLPALTNVSVFCFDSQRRTRIPSSPSLAGPPSQTYQPSS